MMALCAPVFFVLFVCIFFFFYIVRQHLVFHILLMKKELHKAPWVVTSEKSAMIFQLVPKSSNFVTLVLAAGHVRSMTKCISDVRKVNPLILV